MASRGFLVLLCLLCTRVVAAESLSVMVRGHLVSAPVFSLFAAPGERLRLGLLDTDPVNIDMRSPPTVAGRPGEDHWLVEAPAAPGLYSFTLAHRAGSGSTTFNLFVGYPGEAVRDGKLNGYRIGPSPPAHVRYPGFYASPELFFEVTPETVDTQLSPNFTLKQFLCKQDADYPKYLVIQESLLVLLEGLLEAVREAGYPADTFGVISAYRTPYYNELIGNVPNSRHVYGDAMDLFVDMDGDGHMDDLNGDGERNAADVDLLFEIVQAYKRMPGASLLVGGVGRYYSTIRHGGFVHVDARGFRARW